MKRKNIIIITSRVPYPLDKGDKLRIYHQIKYISKNHNIFLISLHHQNIISKKDTKELLKYCKEIFIIKISFINRVFNMLKSFVNHEPIQVGYFYSNKAHKKIQRIIKKIKPDWCYFQLIRTGKYVNNNENNIIDYMDAFSKGIERRINNFPQIIRPLVKREFLITRNYETNAFNKFKKHTIITENDRDFIRHKHNNQIHVIPNGVDTNYFQPRKKKKEYDIVFVGNMNYPPNIEAANYLCKQIIPIIEKKYKTCKVLIGGANPHRTIKQLKSKNIHISGWVNDIREIYASGTIFVAPMFIGTGLQNKLLEAMSMGLPCVTTHLANKALLANSSQIIIANNPVDFAEACIKLLKNKQLANEMKLEALKFVKEKYDWNKINHKLEQLFE